MLIDHGPFVVAPGSDCGYDTGVIEAPNAWLLLYLGCIYSQHDSI